jgi:hypothetical protein
MTTGLAAGHASSPTRHKGAPRHAAPTAHRDSEARLDAVAFHDQWRALWEDHVTWTRLAIVTKAKDAWYANADVRAFPRRFH